MAKSAVEQLIDLYNAANPTLPFPATLDDVEVYDHPLIDDAGTGRNTMTYLVAKEESKYFVGSMTVRYNRLQANFNGDIVNESISLWEDDEYVLNDMNLRLQQSWPEDEFLASELDIERTTNEDGEYVVNVGWARSIRFQPPMTDTQMYEFVIRPPKTDLSTTSGELDGFV